MATTISEAAAGREARKRAPRSSHADWEPAAGRPDPVALLEEEEAPRLRELLSVRHERMAVSAFAFFRGSAGLMAADLAGTPSTGVTVQLCGDAHLSNFGGFASPERNLVFDLNDFDETLPGPWEWDVKRLAASIVIAARERGLGRRRQAAGARAAVRAYRQAIRGFARMRAIDVWYARLDAGTLRRHLRASVDRDEAERIRHNVAKARRKDSARAFAKLGVSTNGAARIAADPPLITPVEDVAGIDGDEIEAFMQDLMSRYRATLPSDRRRLLDRYRYVHAARKVVGVGSVGTRCWVLLLLGRDASDPLFLQAKEAERSALEPHAGPSEHEHQGQRVVEGQRLMQAAGDTLLGWVRAEGIDGQARDFYVRQLWDWKASADVDRLSPEALEIYGALCAWTLARAHARSGDAAAIAGYLGSGDVFDRAVASFAEAYADQNERDYAGFVDALESGRLAASPSAAA